MKGPQMRHTKTPWKVSENKCEITAINDDSVICATDFIAIPKVIYEANARFIVQAVNSHEELVEALKEAQNYIGLFTRAQGHDPKNEPTYQRIESALLKATGEKQ